MSEPFPGVWEGRWQVKLERMSGEGRVESCRKRLVMVVDDGRRYESVCPASKASMRALT